MNKEQTPTNWIRNLIVALEAHDGFEKLSVVNNRFDQILEIEVFVHGRMAHLQVDISPLPNKLPIIRLDPPNSFGFIPHIDPFGIVCFTETEGQVVDRSQSVKVVIEALNRAIITIVNGIKGDNQADFVDEFEAYWKYNANAVHIFSCLSPQSRLCKIVIGHNKDNTLLYAALTEQELNSFYNSRDRQVKLTIENGLYIPLKENFLVIPPDPNGAFWTIEELREIVKQGLGANKYRHLKKLLRRKYRKIKYVIFSLPRQSGGESFFGVKFGHFETEHPLIENGSVPDILPIQIERVDRDYLVGRGGGNTKLEQKNVLLVGCGAIGGSLSIELAKAGISKLTLVDPDYLQPENTYRHLLGRKHWGKPKVEGLKSEIEAQLPYVDVTTFKYSIERLLGNQNIVLSDYDIVILATGNHTIELEINEQIHAKSLSTMLLTTWVEPLGLGGHVLLANNASDGGCLQCIYTSPYSESEFFNRAAFAAPNQFFGRALSGCGTLHTPFGSVDASQTAILATRLAIDALIGSEVANPLLSWRGNSVQFINEGFQLSNRYQILEADLYKNRYSYKTACCSVCGSRIQN